MVQLTIQQAFDLAIQHHQAGRLQEAERIYRQMLGHEPKHFGALHYLGVIAHQVGRYDVAVELIRQALALQPNYPEAHVNLGEALKAQGQLEEAIAAYRQGIALRPAFPDAHYNLGNALKDTGQLDEAIVAYRQAIILKPAFPEAHSNLGVALSGKGKQDEAIAACRQALGLRGNFPEAYCNLGNALIDTGQLDQAIAAYRQAVALNPNYAEAHSNLGNALKYDGQLDQSIAAFRHALALKPNYPEAHSSLIFTLNYHPGYDAPAIAEESGRWNRQHAEPLKPFVQRHGNDRSPERRLRVGYVSGDFREHPVGRFLLPLLEHHDKRCVEVFAYAQAPAPDALTQRLRSYTEGWRNIVGLSDAQTTELIRQDGIDILIDLAGHTAHNRLLVFARKPAPVQITWLGYPGTSGLTTMDYRLSDPWLEPSDLGRAYSSEEPLCLPATSMCYWPRPDSPGVGPLPAITLGRVTFGCLNNPSKLTDAMLATWAKVMLAASGSDLLLYAHEGGVRDRLREKLGRHGIDPQRIRFVGHGGAKYLDFFQQIDLCLDPFPYNGGTTTCDALWMGVPVVSLVGQTICSRLGLSALSNIGMQELAANTLEQYARIAGELANDPPRLSRLRATLRGRMEASPLMDGAGFARNVEAAYRRVWRRWCEADGDLVGSFATHF